jgi:hypothetical protein
MPEPTPLRTLLETSFSIFPLFFFQALQVLAALLNALLGAFGITGVGVTAL